MNFFRKITEGIKEKAADLQEKKEFLKYVDDETRDIRRAAYLEQKKIDAVKEGKQIAMKDTAEKMKKNKVRENKDYDKNSIPLDDPFKFFNKRGREWQKT